MDREELLHYVALCSLLCYTCPGLKDGAISECAQKLCNYFEGYYDFNYDNIPKQNRSWLNEFEEFRNKLSGYTKANCAGCRNHPLSGAGCICRNQQVFLNTNSLCCESKNGNQSMIEFCYLIRHMKSGKKYWIM